MADHRFSENQLILQDYRFQDYGLLASHLLPPFDTIKVEMEPQVAHAHPSDRNLNLNPCGPNRFQAQEIG